MRGTKGMALRSRNGYLVPIGLAPASELLPLQRLPDLIREVGEARGEPLEVEFPAPVSERTRLLCETLGVVVRERHG